MATLEYIYELRGWAIDIVVYRESIAEWQQDFDLKIRKIGEAVAEDRGITLEKAGQLPLDTKLCPSAETAFREFCLFLEYTLIDPD